MARAPNEKVKQAYALYLQGSKLIDIANTLDVPEGTVRRWKSTYKWNSERSDKNIERSHKKGGQFGNRNAIGNGAPSSNKNAEKHGFFSKWLPEETKEIMQSIQESDPLDLLWDNIQLQYTAIIRAQKLMYVKDQQDKTVEKVGEKQGNVSSEDWEVQQAWDKHATFLQAQSRAMKTLESMIKQYEDMLHKNWDMATEEQKARIAVLKSKANVSEHAETDKELSNLIKMIEISSEDRK